MVAAPLPDFEFATATRIVFGPGQLDQVGKLAAGLGHKALVVSGRSATFAARLLSLLDAAGLAAEIYTVEGEPQVETAQQGVALARRAGCDLVLSLGGGSAIDTGKAISALLTNPGDALDYLEVVGRGQALQHPAAPFIAIPTTAGTGAEVTRNAVLGVPAQQVKVSLRSPLMLPRLALVDPELTYSLPPEVTASTGLDALTQLIEPYTSNRPNPLTDAICREGMGRAARSLLTAYETATRMAQTAEESDALGQAARQNMTLASLFGGLALANAKLGAVHGFAAPLGGQLDAPHGALCARLLPLVMSANLHALRQASHASNGSLHPALERYREVAQILTGDAHASAEDGVSWVRDLTLALHIPPLSSYGLQPGDLPALVEKAAKASSMQGNPISLTPAEMQAILEQAL